MSSANAGVRRVDSILAGRDHGARPTRASFWKGQTIFAVYLESFADLDPLRERVLVVLTRLPDEVRGDLFEDPRFFIALDDFVPGKGRTVWLASPAPGGKGSRCVVLKPRLADCSEAFAHYVIAHELAHAYLRHGGWGGVTDPEAAADALAANWGFPKPAI